MQLSSLCALKDLKFDNRFTRELPSDANKTNSRRQVFEACYSRVLPTPVRGPEVVSYSPEVAELLGLDPSECAQTSFASIFGGNEQLPGMDPFAMCYGGHQFGNWAGQLGDGRAINLGEVINHHGDHWTLQLKGAGPTPYSRTADGLAVLRSSVREYLCSEAMHHLGVPTTRALSLVLTGEQVRRDMFYDGNPQMEPGAVVCRVAPSFLRFGNYQIFAARNDKKNLKRLVDFTIRNDFPHLGEPCQETYEAWFHEVCQTTAEMIVHWMRVGFVHGVMNTDNMSILGLTIDYGPYGWLEDFDPGWTPNTTDATGRRYRFGNQPRVAQWNLYQLANALLLLFEQPKVLEEALESYADKYNDAFKQMMASKLGLREYRATDDDLFTQLQEVLQLTEIDMTIFYRRLADWSASDSVSHNDEELIQPLADAFYLPGEVNGETAAKIATWLRSYRERIAQDDCGSERRVSRMNSVNPKYVLRNYLAQLAIDRSEEGDHSMVNELLNVLRNPYDEQPEFERYAEKRPDWARTRAGCSMLSCSS